MKLAEIKRGQSYAYNEHSIRLLDEETVRVTVLRVPVTFKVRSWRGLISYTGARVRLPSGATTNVEARRLLAPWADCLAYRKEVQQKREAQERRSRAHKALCGRLQKELRRRTGVDVVVDTGWSTGGFEIHLTKERGDERKTEDEVAELARRFVKSLVA